MDGVILVTNQNVNQYNNDDIKSDALKVLMENPIFAYYYDLEKGEKRIRIFTDDILQESYKELMESVDYKDALRNYIKWYVHPDDAKKIEELAIDVPIYELMKESKNITVYYRHKYSVGYLYNKISVHRLVGEDGSLKKVFLLCQEADEEIREELGKIEARKQYSKVLSAVAREYSSLYYVDLKRGIHTVFTVSDRIEGMFGDYFFKTNYEAAVSAYIASAVAEKDKAFLTKVLDREYLIRQTKIREYFTEVYLNNDGKYCEMKCVRVPAPDGGYDMVMGFAVKDEQIRAEAENKRKMMNQLSLLDGLSQEYSSVWTIKPNDRSYSLVRYQDENDVDEYISTGKSSVNYDAGMNKYIEQSVFEEDIARVKNATQFDVVMDALEKKKTYSVSYRHKHYDGEICYYQMCFGVAQVEGGERQIVLAFRNVEEMIHDEIEARNRLASSIEQRDTDGLTGLNNRQCFERRLMDFAHMGAKTISCVYMDVDGLHVLNEKKGHQAGDDVLRMVSKELSTLWRKENIFRVGGDEFVIILPDVESEITLSRIDILRADIEKEGYHVSIGFSITNGNQIDMAKAISEAETYMYKEKTRYYEMIGQPLNK